MSIAARMAMTMALTLAACGERAPVVEVNTYVGPSHARNDPQLRQQSAKTVARTVLAELVPARTTPVVEEGPVRDDPIHAPNDAEELARLTKAIRTAPLDEIDGAARRLAAAGPAVWPQVREGLLAKRKGSTRAYRSLLEVIGGDVPNRYGHFARSWKKAHGFSVKLSTDWFSDLLTMRTGRVSRGLHDVYRDCVVRTALLRAAANIGSLDPAVTGEVVAVLLDVAYEHKGTFRDEVGRALQGVGNEAIPYLLIESMRPLGRRKKDKREDIPVLRAEYASLQLDKMDRLHPQRATTAVREDPRLLARVLHAYATVRPGEAAAVLLDYADAEDPSVRSAARAAFTAYVDGPPPPIKGRTIRLLGGGKGRAMAQLNYRARAGLAIRERMSGELPEQLEPECELQREDGSTDRRCEGQPARLTAVYFTWLEQRRAEADRSAIADALAQDDVQQRVRMLDRLLAGNPTLATADQLVPVYAEAADDALAQGEVARAGQLLRKAAQLAEPDDAEAGRTLRVRALLAEASVPQLTPEGRRMLLSSAQALAPQDPRIDAALSQLGRPSAEASVASRERLAPVMGMVAGLWGLGLMGSWWRRRRSRRTQA